MADRLTQLQDAVNQQADNFCNSIGVLQQHSLPLSFHEIEKSSPRPTLTGDDHTQNFASSIAKTAKDIDLLIESLPTEEFFSETPGIIRRLEDENQSAAEQLKDAIERGEKLLEEIRKALHDIAQSQLEIQKLQDPVQS